MTYARARLWLGVSCVGTLVVLTSVALWLALPQQMLPQQPENLATEAAAVAAFLGVIALMLLPFDVLGGLALPESFDQPCPNIGRFFVRHLRGMLLQLSFFTVSFLIYRRVGSSFGIGATVGCFAAMQVLLIGSQKFFAIAIGGLRKARVDESDSNVLVAEHEDRGFTGGVAGLPGLETTVVPRLWIDSMPENLCKTAIQRRAATITSGSRLRGLAVAIGWNTACFSAALFLPGGGVGSIAALATSFLYFLLLSFVGLLILPTFSRRGVFEVDQFVARETPTRDIVSVASALERMGDDEPSRTPGLESVFHPVPCVQRRSDALQSGSRQTTGAWNAARMALFLSWAFGGPLARAVHCNIGRPELWVMLPAD